MTIKKKINCVFQTLGGLALRDHQAFFFVKCCPRSSGLCSFSNHVHPTCIKDEKSKLGLERSQIANLSYQAGVFLCVHKAVFHLSVSQGRWSPSVLATGKKEGSTLAKITEKQAIQIKFEPHT